MNELGSFVIIKYMLLRKNIVYIILVIILFITVIGLIKYKKSLDPLSKLPKPTNTSEDVLLSLDTKIITKEDQDLAKKGWETFSLYLKYSKNKDIEGLKSLSYKLSSLCTTQSLIKDCHGALDEIVMVGNLFKESDFTHILHDNMQIILFSDYKKEIFNESEGYVHTTLYFIRDSDDKLKIVGFGPSEGIYLSKTLNPDTTILTDKIADKLRDTDKDGQADYVELCLEPQEGIVCVKTDPLIRDTDKNGYWDSIQTLMNNK